MLKAFTYVQTLAAELRTRQEGQTMAEYGVVLAVITVALIALFATLSDQIGNALNDVINALTGADVGTGD
jgi:Flp pilus assembly pilin Flp